MAKPIFYFLVQLLLLFSSGISWADSPSTSYAHITLEKIEENGGGISFGFGENFGQTSKFDWQVDYAPNISDIYPINSDNQRQYEGLVAPELIRNLSFTKISTSFNFLLGLNNSPEITMFFLIGFGYTVLEAYFEPNSGLSQDLIDANNFSFPIGIYGIGIEAAISKDSSFEITLRRETSLERPVVSSARFNNRTIRLSTYEIDSLRVTFRSYYGNRFDDY